MIGNIKSNVMPKRNGTSPRITALFSAATLIVGMAFWGCNTGSEAEATAKIISPANGSVVVGPNVLLKVAVTNFTFAGTALAKTAASQAAVPKGHIHVFIDKPIGADADAAYQMSLADTITMTGLAIGVHYINIQGAQANHVDVESMVDSVKFTVIAPVP